MKILVVDDTECVRELIKLILKREGFEVVEAYNGRDALYKMQGIDVDLVLSDLEMPEMNGIEFIAEMRRLLPYKSIPVVMLSTEFSDNNHPQAVQLGINKWILKPFIPRYLKEIVRKFDKKEPQFCN